MRGRRRLILMVATVTAVLAAGLAAIALAAGGSRRHEAAQLLRLGDLPLGYVTNELQEDRGHVAQCQPLTKPDDTPARMLKFIQRFHPRGCIFGFTFSYGEPESNRNPLLIGTGVMDAGSKAEADAAWAVVPELLGRLLNDKVPQQVKAPVRIGFATRLFHGRARIYYGRKDEPITFLVWRTGNTVAAVMTAGLPFAIDDAAAQLLAEHQQIHIVKPTPLKTADNYDGEVALENPALDLPVYWLGREFRPGGGLPRTQLVESGFVPMTMLERLEKQGLGAEEPVSRLRLRYEEAISLTTWAAAEWSGYTHSQAGKEIVTWKCTKTSTVPVSGGTATIYTGYERAYSRCPSTAPTVAVAWVRYGEDTVVVNAPYFGATRDPYASTAAMKRTVRALRLRTPPAS